jgi:hypothetical protein
VTEEKGSNKRVTENKNKHKAETGERREETMTVETDKHI